MRNEKRQGRQSGRMSQQTGQHLFILFNHHPRVCARTQHLPAKRSSEPRLFYELLVYSVFPRCCLANGVISLRFWVNHLHSFIRRHVLHFFSSKYEMHIYFFRVYFIHCWFKWREEWHACINVRNIVTLLSQPGNDYSLIGRQNTATDKMGRRSCYQVIMAGNMIPLWRK